MYFNSINLHLIFAMRIWMKEGVSFGIIHGHVPMVSIHVRVMGRQSTPVDF